MADNRKKRSAKEEKGFPLAKIAKSFKETVNTLKDFLIQRGMKEAENYSPNNKISAEHYALLKQHFGKDKDEISAKHQVPTPDIVASEKSSSEDFLAPKIEESPNDSKDTVDQVVDTPSVVNEPMGEINLADSPIQSEQSDTEELYHGYSPKIKGLTIKGKLEDTQIEFKSRRKRAENAPNKKVAHTSKKSTNLSSPSANNHDSASINLQNNSEQPIISSETATAPLDISLSKSDSENPTELRNKEKISKNKQSKNAINNLPKLIVTKSDTKDEMVEDSTYENIDISDKIDTQYEKLAGVKVIGKIELGPDSGGRTRKRRVVVSRTEKPKKSVVDNQKKERDAKMVASSAEKVIDRKTIQDKIKETQEKLLQSSSRNLKSIRQKRRNKKTRNQQDEVNDEEQVNKVIQVAEFLTLQEFAALLDVNFTEVIAKCMHLGLMVSINQRLDAEVMELIAEEYGFKINFSSVEEEEPDLQEDREEDLVPCPPVVTVMGHVDHGKTSLIDYIRTTNVVANETGGITQKIGAYVLNLPSGNSITFLDTPGHEVFTAMRARGTKVADIAVIIIAADDAVMPQTKEAISHAKAAATPMVFAINKVDKPGANPEKIKEQLAQMDILVEDWGGKYQCQEVSARTGLNIDVLLEKIILEAELLNLRANPKRAVIGTILDSRLDKGRGHMASVLVQAGTLRVGDIVVSGEYYGKVKALFNERIQRVDEAKPATPILVLGLNGNPPLGERLHSYESESEARSIAAKRSQIQREQMLRTRKHITLDEIGRRLALGNFKELNIILKADVNGTVEALSDALQQLSTEEVAVKIIHKGVGQIIESDVMLAVASDAIIIAFQVRPSMQAAKLAQAEDVQIKTYSVIYHVIEEIKNAMEGLMEPHIEEKTVANIDVKEIFKFDKLTVAGSKVIEGKLLNTHKIRVIRDGVVLHTGEIASLKHYKDDIKEVIAGRDCGIVLKNFNDLQAGDQIEAYIEEEVKRKL